MIVLYKSRNESFRIELIFLRDPRIDRFLWNVLHQDRREFVEQFTAELVASALCGQRNHGLNGRIRVVTLEGRYINPIDR